MNKSNEGATARSGWMRPEAAEEVLPLPRILEALAAVRRRVRAVLTDWDLAPEVADDALLVVSEMITNAVMHALPPATLRLSRVTGHGGCTLRVEVTDAGPAAQRRRGVRDTLPEEHGRGIAIVAALSFRCGARVHPGGVTRWADLRVA
ncbi:anti-sigma regulatory factor (Ser/Thr protein kinase) [Streptomyces sp. SLBN-118]|uniref:ATP-binding protein n=1 Tax=Streptomyces sp. SLBN-118 TaxID=2768454 RepID=UPI001174ACF3|nr:ATP-binding protein [Streptomyces sp. SLBN-118]TQK51970.1 anti-sigma regulatory factor (Ser/Thr protein kinase) [Streptomyces sp. SLBN-118]